MISLPPDCIRYISSFLSLYHKIILSRVCKTNARALEEILKNEPALQTHSLWEKLFDKSPRLKVLRMVNRALKAQPPLQPPSSALKIQATKNYQLVFHKEHIELYSRGMFGWSQEMIIKAPVLNHFLCADTYIVNYDERRIVATMILNNLPLLIPYDKTYPILQSLNFFCYVTNNQTVIFTKNGPRPLKQLGFTFLHETEIFLYLIASRFIVHYNIKTRELIEESIEVPKVVSAQEDLLVCDTAIIQLNRPKSHIIYKK